MPPQGRWAMLPMTQAERGCLSNVTGIKAPAVLRASGAARCDGPVQEVCGRDAEGCGPTVPGALRFQGCRA
jgi:hypothetical protein